MATIPLKTGQQAAPMARRLSHLIPVYQGDLGSRPQPAAVVAECRAHHPLFGLRLAAVFRSRTYPCVVQLYGDGETCLRSRNRIVRARVPHGPACRDGASTPFTLPQPIVASGPGTLDRPGVTDSGDRDFRAAATRVHAPGRRRWPEHARSTAANTAIWSRVGRSTGLSSGLCATKTCRLGFSSIPRRSDDPTTGRHPGGQVTRSITRSCP